MTKTLVLNQLAVRLIIILALLLTAFLVGISQQSILLSPSHPFVDNNNNGIDDFEEEAGTYADPEVRAKIYGVNFPIAELGNCGDYAACRTFCEDPVNATTCLGFGKAKGFYQDDPIDTKRDEILKRAQDQFGCDSYDSCLNFCSVPVNFDKCSSFAKANNLIGGHVDDPRSSGVLEKAKAVLGCSSPEACMSFCDQPANRGKCSQFAQEAGLRGGEHQVGPGGCSSEASCQAFCSTPTSFSICAGFTQAAGGQFKGPGGCDSEGSCRDYCSKNPSACGSFGGPGPGGSPGPGGGPFPGYHPQEMCNRSPGCAWSNNTCQCGNYTNAEESRQRADEYASFCRQNPAGCGPGGSGGFETATQRSAFENYCRDNPDRCQASGGSSGYVSTGYDPAKECAKYGCAWTGNSCQCTSGGSGAGVTPSYSPAPGYSPPPGSSGSYGTYSPPPGSYTPPAGSYTNYSPPPSGSYTLPSSGSYTPPAGSYTPPSDTSQPPPPSEPAPQPQSQPAPPPSEPAPPPPSGVQGASTGQGLLQMLWSFLTGK